MAGFFICSIDTAKFRIYNSGNKMQPMVTPPNKTIEVVRSDEVVFTTKLASLGKSRDRWYIPIPKGVSRLVAKEVLVEVRVRAIGTISR